MSKKRLSNMMKNKALGSSTIELSPQSGSHFDKIRRSKTKTANINTPDIVNITMRGIKYAIYVAMKLELSIKTNHK